jgi:cellulose biosynthesis protein BcsQ
VSESVFEAADALLVPIVPATLSSRTFEQLRDHATDGARSPQLLAFFSMVDGRKRLHRDVVMDMSSMHPAVLQTVIPAATEVERMGHQRTPVAVFAPRSRACAAYEALWREVRAALESVGHVPDPLG